jgi:hypothetical protein
VFKYLLGIAAIAALIAFGVDKLQEKGTKAGPTVVTINVPNPIPGGGGGGGGGNPIYVP